jgi:outer membrane lipoprotein-sorting protein
MTKTAPSRRRLIALAAAALLAPAAASAQGKLSAADQALVEKARVYLQGIGQLQGRFTQTDPGGRVSSGEIWIARPGKARFAYDAPKDMLIVSDGRNVSVYDRRLKTYNAYPLSRTPLSLFLAKDIRLDKGVEVTEVTRFANGFAVTARDSRRETRGWISLTFADDPMRLTEWTVTDAQGARTRVKLSGLRPASGLSPSLFVSRNPLRSGG